ncbi:MAG TPA: gamma-glutamyl-gamma-aminobutyrate hydrolase family protein [Prolixibacteraceae bacterium]|jgi:putative glutamine amidotransferase
MRKARFQIKSLLLLTIVLLIAFRGQAQHRLVLLHPTVSNIVNIEWMVENKMIDIPELEMVGVYYAKEAYDYSASVKYLAEHPLTNYKLLKIEGELKPEDIYRENSCTPAFRKLFENSDAILFFGGPDIPAAIYGDEQNLLTIVTDPYRHYFETSLFFHLIGGSQNPDFKPFLAEKPDFIIRAFCLGMQTMNVAAGGTLIQDIPQEIYHLNTLERVSTQPVENQHRSYTSPLYPLDDLWGGSFHPITISKNGYLSEIAALSGVATPTVLSYHHQAVGRVGANLAVIASSIDSKVIEGLQHVKFKNVVGVQFHPEPSVLYDPKSKLTTVPGSPFSPNELMVKSNSLLFHKLFWKDFSEKVNQSKKFNKN